MKQIKEKILLTAIELFNSNGVGNVRVKDIAEAAEISPGNLTYHFKTKKELMSAVYKYMVQSLEKMTLGESIFLESIDVIELTKTYLNFQVRYRFFYRDTLEIMRLYPEIKDAYRRQVKQIINFNQNIIFLLVGKGQLIPEPHEGHYLSLAKNIWAVQNSWLSEREILGSDSVDIYDGIQAGMDLTFPYLTEKGKEFYFKVKKDLPDWLEQDKAVI